MLSDTTPTKKGAGPGRAWVPLWESSDLLLSFSIEFHIVIIIHVNDKTDE